MRLAFTLNFLVICGCSEAPENRTVSEQAPSVPTTTTENEVATLRPWWHSVVKVGDRASIFRVEGSSFVRVWLGSDPAQGEITSIDDESITFRSKASTQRIRFVSIERFVLFGAKHIASRDWEPATEVSGLRIGDIVWQSRKSRLGETIRHIPPYLLLVNGPAEYGREVLAVTQQYLLISGGGALAQDLLPMHSVRGIRRMDVQP